MWANAKRDGRPAEYRWHLHWATSVQSRSQDMKPVEICWGAPNSPTDLSR